MCCIISTVTTDALISNICVLQQLHLSGQGDVLSQNKLFTYLLTYTGNPDLIPSNCRFYFHRDLYE